MTGSFVYDFPFLNLAYREAEMGQVDIYLDVMVMGAYVDLHVAAKIMFSFLEPKGSSKLTEKTASFLLWLG